MAGRLIDCFDPSKITPEPAGKPALIDPKTTAKRDSNDDYQPGLWAERLGAPSRSQLPAPRPPAPGCFQPGSLLANCTGAMPLRCQTAVLLFTVPDRGKTHGSNGYCIDPNSRSRPQGCVGTDPSSRPPNPQQNSRPCPSQ